MTEANTYVLPVPKAQLFRLLCPTAWDIAPERSLKRSVCDILDGLKERLKETMPREPSLNCESSSERLMARKKEKGLLRRPKGANDEFPEFGQPNAETGGQHFDWSKVEEQVMRSATDKYGFVEKYKKAICAMCSKNGLHPNGGCLESVTEECMEDLIQVHGEYGALLYGTLGIKNASKPSAAFQDECNKCTVPLEDRTVRGHLKIDSVQLPHINYWESGIGSSSMVVELMIVNYNLACLYAVKYLKQYRTGKSAPSDVNSDDNLATWEGLESNFNVVFDNKKDQIVNDVRNNRMWTFPKINPPKNWIVDSSDYGKLTAGSDANKRNEHSTLDAINKSDTFNHVRWCDKTFFSDDDLKAYTMIMGSSPSMLPSDSVELNELNRTMDRYFNPITTDDKLNFINGSDADSLKRLHKARFPAADQSRYENTMFTCNERSKNLRCAENKNRALNYGLGLTKALYYVRKVESLLKSLPNPDFIRESSFFDPPETSSKTALNDHRNDIDFTLSEQNVVVMRLIMEKMIKLIQLDSSRYQLLGNDKSPKFTKWNMAYVFVNYCSKPCEGESEALRKGYISLQLDALRCGALNPNYNRSGVPWNSDGLTETHGGLRIFNASRDGSREEKFKNEASKAVNGILSAGKEEVKSFIDELVNTASLRESEKTNASFDRRLKALSNDGRESFDNGEYLERFPSVSKTTTWCALLASNYYRFLVGYVEVLHRHFLGVHWALVNNQKMEYFQDMAQAQDKLISCNGAIDFFHRSILMSELNLPSSWHYFACESGSCCPGSSSFQPLFSHLLGHNMVGNNNNNATNGSTGSSNKAPFVLLSTSCFLVQKSCSYVRFFKEAFVFASSVLNYNCKLMHVTRSTEKPRPAGLMKAAESKIAEGALSVDRLLAENNRELELVDFVCKMTFSDLKQMVKRRRAIYVVAPSIAQAIAGTGRIDTNNAFKTGKAFCLPPAQFFASQNQVASNSNKVADPQEDLLEEIFRDETEKTYKLTSFLVGVLALNSSQAGGLSSFIRKRIDCASCASVPLSPGSPGFEVNEGGSSYPLIKNALVDCVIRHYTMTGGYPGLCACIDRKTRGENKKTTASQTTSWVAMTEELISFEIPLKLLNFVKIAWLEKITYEIPQFKT